MSHIDRVITDAQLRDVKVYDFDVSIDAVEIDIENHRKMLKRYGLEKDKTLTALEQREQHLRDFAIEWVSSVGLSPHRDHRIVILIEETTE